MRKQTTTRVEKLYHGRLRIERRNASPILYARAYLQGRLARKNTKETNLNAAIKVATEWYLEQLDRIRKGENIHGHRTLFAECVRKFIAYAKSAKKVTQGQIQNYEDKWRAFEKLARFDGLTIHDIDLAWLEAFRDERATHTNKRGEPISNNTLRKDMDFLRLVCRFSMERLGALKTMPPFPSFKGREWTVEDHPREFFTYDEWKILRDRAKRRMNEPGLTPAQRTSRSELYCLILMLVGGALRPEEAHSLRWRDCTEGVVDDADQTECIHVRVFGKHAKTKRGREHGWLLYEGVKGFRLLKSLRPATKPDDLLFPQKSYRTAFEGLLTGDEDDADLREVRVDDRVELRSLRSLRQTGISMRLDMGPDPSYRDIAKWARTHATHIESFYDLTHPKDSIKRITGFRREPVDPRVTAEIEKMRSQLAAPIDTDDHMGEDRETGDEPWNQA
jgi:hypothetical protein